MGVKVLPKTLSGFNPMLETIIYSLVTDVSGRVMIQLQVVQFE